MADDLAQPHASLFRAVFGDPAEAAGLLRAHLPEGVAHGLDWSTLTVEKSHFVAPELRATESDLLYSIRRRAGGRPAWLYVLLEHQSTSKPRERWLRLRLLRYCCRIWERDRRPHPDETELHPIVPLVLYQGRGRWRHATEFSDLFAREVRAWPWLPHFEHLLIDQSTTPPEEVRGTLRGRLTQLMMMAVYRATGGWSALQRTLLLHGCPFSLIPGSRLSASRTGSGLFLVKTGVLNGQKSLHSTLLPKARGSLRDPTAHRSFGVTVNQPKNYVSDGYAVSQCAPITTTGPLTATKINHWSSFFGRIEN